MAKKLDLKNIREFRKSQSKNQHDFWSQFGVTQSGGSRYESGRDMPIQVGALIWLLSNGKIDDKTLKAALKAAGAQ